MALRDDQGVARGDRVRVTHNHAEAAGCHDPCLGQGAERAGVCWSQLTALLVKVDQRQEYQDFLDHGLAPDGYETRWCAGADISLSLVGRDAPSTCQWWRVVEG